MRRLSEAEKTEIWDRFEASDSLRADQSEVESSTVHDPDSCGCWRVP